MVGGKMPLMLLLLSIFSEDVLVKFILCDGFSLSSELSTTLRNNNYSVAVPLKKFALSAAENIIFLVCLRAVSWRDYRQIQLIAESKNAPISV